MVFVLTSTQNIDREIYELYIYIFSFQTPPNHALKKDLEIRSSAFRII